jgi:lipoprotein-releasing system ATP-binding protein
MKPALSSSTLAVERVGKVYPGEVPTRALNGVSFAVAPGEFVAIVGASGSGKTSLLNLLGLLDSATEGTIHLNGVDVTNLTPGEAVRLRRDMLGFIFQFHYLLPEFSALENALMPCRLAGEGQVARQEPGMLALFDRVGLAGKLNKRPHQLSGGEQQRVAILRALANDPLFILADEPTGNLDSANANEIFTLLRNITREMERTVIMVTHDHELAAKADRVITLRDGRIESDRPASALAHCS